MLKLKLRKHLGDIEPKEHSKLTRRMSLCVLPDIYNIVTEKLQEEKKNSIQRRHRFVGPRQPLSYQSDIITMLLFAVMILPKTNHHALVVHSQIKI
jgi:hypothetical protein